MPTAKTVNNTPVKAVAGGTGAAVAGWVATLVVAAIESVTTVVLSESVESAVVGLTGFIVGYLIVYFSPANSPATGGSLQ